MKYLVVVFLAFAGIVLPMAAAAARFVPSSNGTTRDNVTGLVWQRIDDDVQKTWQEALAYCDSLNLAGSDAWRLPNVKELYSIVDNFVESPAINNYAFVRTKVGPTSRYWSSSTDVQSSDKAWYVIPDCRMDYRSR